MSRGCYIINVIVVLLCSLPVFSQVNNIQQTPVKNPINLYYESYGSGPTIICLHGLGESTFSWRYLVATLSQQYRIILIDLKGFGKSPKPKDSKYSILDQAALIVDFIEKNNLTNITLMGHSLGGGVALLTAIRLLPKIGERLSGLILIDSAGYKQPLPEFIHLLRTPIVGPLVLDILPTHLNVSIALKATYYDDTRITEEEIKTYTTALNSKGGKYALIQTAKQLIPKNLESITARYKEITIPTLILWGRQDHIIPLKVGKALNNAIPKSTLVVFDKCGHVPHKEKPESVLPIIIQFIDDTM